MDTCQIFFLRAGVKPSRNEENLPSHNAMTIDGVMHLPRDHTSAKVYDLHGRIIRQPEAVQGTGKTPVIDGRM
jgi:hypothetical protein